MPEPSALMLRDESSIQCSQETGPSLGWRDHAKAPVAIKVSSCPFCCLADIWINVATPPMQKQKKKGCLVIFVKHKFTFFLSQQLWTGGLRSIKPGPRHSTDRLRSLECCAEMRHRGCVVHRRPPAVWECEALLHVHSSRDCCLLLTFIPSRQLLKLLRS